ncbi:hypothetical protein MKD08_08880 [[Clostridium] innocuum]|nr:hypothetical protein [[Clostridium] innocuum]
MELTKKNCMIAKNRMRGLAYTSCNCREENIDEVNNCDNYLEQLINEHFDNQPLKFEDLEEGMWVWDDKNKIVFTAGRCSNDAQGDYYTVRRYPLSAKVYRCR